MRQSVPRSVVTLLRDKLSPLKGRGSSSLDR